MDGGEVEFEDGGVEGGEEGRVMSTVVVKEEWMRV